MTRVNILLLTADDMGDDTPGCFGGLADATPATDRLAAQSMRFRRAHVPIAVCQPSRSAILTGRWPHRNGAEGFQPIRSGVPVLTDLLRPAGYRVGILGKVTHLAPVERFGWDLAIDMDRLGMGRDPRAYADATSRFLVDAAAAGQPWFLMVNAHDPHRPFHASADEPRHFTADELAGIPPPSRVFSSAEIRPPGFLPDLPQVRDELAQYLSSSRRCDDVVDAVLTTLRSSGREDDTLVIFLSDNGMAFPFAKANCYLHSTRTPLIVRWPGRTSPETVDARHFVSAMDLFPTCCAAADIDPPPDVDGRSLTGLLENTPEADRDHMVTVFHETSAGTRYEMRCIQDHTLGYIWNAWSAGIRQYRAENMEGTTWPAMLDAAQHDADIAHRTAFYLNRAPEELYDLQCDPDCLTNLADDPDHDTDLLRMRHHMAHWLRDVNDPLRDQYPDRTPKP